jgi:hypothetical protein
MQRVSIAVIIGRITPAVTDSETKAENATISFGYAMVAYHSHHRHHGTINHTIAIIATGLTDPEVSAGPVDSGDVYTLEISRLAADPYTEAPAGEGVVIQLVVGVFRRSAKIGDTTGNEKGPLWPVIQSQSGQFSAARMTKLGALFETPFMPFGIKVESSPNWKMAAQRRVMGNAERPLPTSRSKTAQLRRGCAAAFWTTAAPSAIFGRPRAQMPLKPQRQPITRSPGDRERRSRGAPRRSA